MLIKYAALLGVFVCFMLSFIGTTLLYNRIAFHVVFLDVGQGDGSLIHTGERNYIVDCGSSDGMSQWDKKSAVGEYTLIPALKYYGMKRIDMIFISHTDADHVNGIIYLLENYDLYGFEIGGVAFAAGTEHDENYERIVKAVGAENVIGLTTGDKIENDFEVLYPGKEDSMDESIQHSGNDYSLVLEYTNEDKNFSVLYTGDIGGDTEEKMAERIKSAHQDDVKDTDAVPRHTRILKCAHHGSRYSSCDEFLGSYSPDITVISCGEHNMYGHPSQETLERLDKTGCKIYRTDKDGAVVIGD